MLNYSFKLHHQQSFTGHFVRKYSVMVPLEFSFFPSSQESQSYKSWEILFLHMYSGWYLLHFQPPADRVMASRQHLILMDIPSSYSKWTHFTLDQSVCISPVMRVLSGSVEHNEKSRGHSAVILSYWVILVHGCRWQLQQQTPRLHLSQLSHCQFLYNCKGHTITDSLEPSV